MHEGRSHLQCWQTVTAYRQRRHLVWDSEVESKLEEANTTRYPLVLLLSHRASASKTYPTLAAIGKAFCFSCLQAAKNPDPYFSRAVALHCGGIVRDSCPCAPIRGTYACFATARGVPVHGAAIMASTVRRSLPAGATARTRSVRSRGGEACQGGEGQARLQLLPHEVSIACPPAS